MHEPMGLRGVQTRPKIAQSVGFLTPRMIAGHWQAAFSGTGLHLDGEAALGIEFAVGGLDAQPL